MNDYGTTDTRLYFAKGWRYLFIRVHEYHMRRTYTSDYWFLIAAIDKSENYLEYIKIRFEISVIIIVRKRSKDILQYVVLIYRYEPKHF